MSMPVTDDNRFSVKAQAINNFQPRDYDEVTAIYQGAEYIDVKYLQRKSVNKIRRIDATRYRVLGTGEIKEYKTMDDIAKAKSKRSALTRTMAELRYLIRTNFTAKSGNQLFITLTYAQEGNEQPDQKQLYADFKAFMRRLRKHLHDHTLEYIVVFEPQGNGWFHSHLMLKSTSHKHLHIKNEQLAALWSLGYTTTQRLKSSDVGSYYVAYFTDLIDESNLDESDMTANEKSKARVKGGRLAYYPKGFRFYRCSRGIQRPVKEDVLLYSVTQETDHVPVYERAYEISSTDRVDGTTSTINKIYKATYRKPRGGNPWRTGQKKP